MALDITVSLSQTTYNRLREWADMRQQDMQTVIAEHLESTLPDIKNLSIPPVEADADVERERAAYLRLHPQLQDKYAGQYVAIYGGELVDHDIDKRALLTRIDTRYPDSFVWLTRVEETPEREIKLRSPKLIIDDTHS